MGQVRHETGGQLDSSDVSAQSGVMPIYDLEAASTSEGFYDHPFPSDLRLSSTGAPDLSTLYVRRPVELVDTIINDLLIDIRRLQGSIEHRSNSIQISSQLAYRIVLDLNSIGHCCFETFLITWFKLHSV